MLVALPDYIASLQDTSAVAAVGHNQPCVTVSRVVPVTSARSAGYLAQHRCLPGVLLCLLSMLRSIVLTWYISVLAVQVVPCC